MGVTRSGLNLGVTEEFPNHRQTLTERQGLRSKAVPEVMKPDVLKPGARPYAVPVAVEVRQARARSAARNDPGIAGGPR